MTRRNSWVVVGTLLLVMTVIHGVITSGLPVLDKAILKELGVSRGELKLRETIFLMSSGLSGLAIGFVTTKIPPRYVVLAGLALLSAALAAYSHAHTIGQIYALYVLLGLSYACAHVVVVVLMIREAFDRRRTLATSIALSGTSLGAAIFPTITVIATRNLDWRGALHSLAVLPLLVLPIAALLLLGLKSSAKAADARPAPAASEPARATRRGPAAAALLAVATFGTFFASTSFLLNLFLYIQDLGRSAEAAAAGISTVFVVGLFGKALVGLAAERWGVPLVWRSQQAVLLAGAVLLTSGLAPALFPALALLGLGWAGCYVLTQVMIADFFAGPNLSRMTGLFIVFEAISSGAGVWSAGAIADLTGGYRPAFLLNCSLIVVAILAGWLATRLPTPRAVQRELPPATA